MNKSIPALALLALCSGALAQSNVALYGVVDLGLSVDSGGPGGTSTRVSSGMASQSRWGFRGTEDLGGGLAAFFNLEGGFYADAGGSTQNNTLFGRTSALGLRGKLGAVSFGLQDVPLFTTLNTVVDPLRNGIARSNNLMSPAGFRTGNSILYQSNDMSGFSGDLMYVAGEVAGDAAAGSAVGGSFGYSERQFAVRIAFHRKNNDSATAKHREPARNFLLGANYDFGPAKAFFGYEVDRGPNSAVLNNPGAFGAKAVASTDSTDMLLGLSAPLGASTLVATYVHKDDKTAFDQDARQYALAYLYALSKRSDLYTSYAVIRNHNGAGYTAGNSTEPGTGNRQFTAGLRHRF